MKSPHSSVACTEAYAPVIVIHRLAHAVAALSEAAAAARPVVLLSAPAAGVSAGAGWFREIIEPARRAVPQALVTTLLDCGDDTGMAQAAIRAGVEGVVLTGRPEVMARLAEIAVQRGVNLVFERPVATLDLASQFFASPEALRECCAIALAS
ncbi:MAG: hypothetical protein JO001_04395 [Alphaproteobacteria bacterium]|nr:hypothetical protein [Alphaproteobacteria bacterium]